MKKMVKYDDGLVFYPQWQILQTYHEKNISMRHESCFVLDQQNESSFFNDKFTMFAGRQVNLHKTELTTLFSCH